MKIRLRILVGVLGAALFAGSAQADEITTLTLNGVTMNGGGSMTGTFQLDDTTSSLTNIDISLSGSPDFADVTLTSTVASPSFCMTCSPSDQPEFRIFQGGFSVFLDISSPLLLNGSNPLLLDPNDANNASDIVEPTLVGINAGALDASTTNVPEPSSIAVLLAGLGLIGCAFHFSRKKMVAAKV